MTADLIPGADPWSHHADAADAPGALVIHGFTGNPGSMRELAEAFAAAGFHVEMPLLPGHGTSVDDMLDTTWADWLAAAEATYQELAARVPSVVVAGLSMGGALTLRLGADHPEIAGLVAVNPATQPLPAEIVEMFDGMVAGGQETMDAIGSDIADPDASEAAYDATPLRPLLSFVRDGLTPLVETYPTATVPLLLLSSPQDHVVDPAQGDYLATHWGGPIERIVLQRSFHVATQDFDKELIFQSAVAFAQKVTAR